MSQLSAPQMSKWVRPMARTGLVAKGVVYCITGILTLMAALQMQGARSNDADKGGVFKMVHEQPLGKVLLSIVVLGMLCFAAWRIIMAIKDTERKGNDLKGLANRAVYLFSGLVYLSLCGVAVKLVLNNEQSSGSSRQKLASFLLESPYGKWLAGIVALGMMGVGILQGYRAISGRYKKYVEKAGYNDQAKSILIQSGMVGYIARGIVWLIVGWLFLKAAINTKASEAGNTGKAFKWLQDTSYGNVLLAVVSFGLVCYGVFMFLRAKYQPIHTT